MSQPYADALSESTRLKLRAGSLLLEGGEDSAYRASVVFHQACRAEASALRALGNPSPEQTLRSLVEQCGCLMDGFDLRGAELLWGRILDASEHLPDRTVRSLTGDLRRRSMEEDKRAKAIRARAPKEMRDDPFLFGVTMARDDAMRRRAAAYFRRVLKAFPGEATYWMLQALVSESAAAWDSIHRCLELVPAEPAYEMAALIVVLGQPEAVKLDYVRRAGEALRLSPNPHPAVCFGVVLAATAIASGTGLAEFWRIARRASMLGGRLVAIRSLEERIFRFFLLAAETSLRGRPVGPEVLSRAGLPRPTGHQDPLRGMLKASPRMVPSFYVAAA